mmetsp:Transcript_19410/g.27325  ORF Transcript_19410/g.27325 Transcript_19410/m.27325 type:complete len:111 (+) Transcript_19410:1-333(+)
MRYDVQAVFEKLLVNVSLPYTRISTKFNCYSFLHLFYINVQQLPGAFSSTDKSSSRSFFRSAFRLLLGGVLCFGVVIPMVGVTPSTLLVGVLIGGSFFDFLLLFWMKFEV